MLHLGRGVFGADFGSVAFVIDRSPANARDTWRRTGSYLMSMLEIRSNVQIELFVQEAGV